MVVFTNTLSNFITHLEKAQTPLINYFITFACILILRNFLEGFSHNGLVNLFFINAPGWFLASDFIHFSLFYAIIALLIILALHGVTREKIQAIIKVVAPGFILILSVPIIDLVVSKGMGHHIAYIFPQTKHNLLYYYFTFFGSLQNISFGMRVEIFMALVCAGFYLQNKQKNVFKTLFGLVLIYSSIFFVIATPYVFKHFAETLHIEIKTTAYVFVNYFLLLLFPLGISMSFLANKRIFIVLAKDLRWLRLLHFELMLILGAALTVKEFNIFLLINFVFLSISILFFWLSAVMINNIHDQTIDSICNPKRPLVTKKIELKHYKNIAVTILFCSLAYALAVNVKSMLIIGGAILAYYIYSAPPLRLKRIPLFSKTIISSTSLAFVFLGYINTRGNWQGFPKLFIWIFLVGFTLTANFIDIKDYLGDKAQRIITLPVLLTPSLAKFFIGSAFICTSLACYFYLQKIFLLPLLLAVGILGFYFINQKKYQEWRVLCLYLLTITGLIVYLLINQLCD
jgi:4-hydroxybenzoate polyprenyltransferase